MLESSLSIQTALFEENYLTRSLGSLSYTPDIALTELVANSWDAGASKVKIFIPENTQETLIIEDNGTGMTPEQFLQRWMTLGYNRLKHQGEFVEFPHLRKEIKRHVYGRNGIGRHGLLCFADEYIVETWRDGIGGRYKISVASGKDPFVLVSQEPLVKDGSGTKLEVAVQRNLPTSNAIREILAIRFMYDPEFEVLVNDISIPFEEHKNLIDKKTLSINETLTLDIYFFDSYKGARTSQQHGIAFWVGGRLVGHPSWNLGDICIADGRTWIAKRHTIVIKTDDLFSEVLPDWSGFKKTPLVEKVIKDVATHIETIIRNLHANKLEENKKVVIREHKTALASLHPLSRIEISSFVEELTETQPYISHEALSAAVKAIINLEKSRAGIALLQKLSTLSSDDLEGLNRLLDDWTIKDALTVLDEIDKRLLVIEAIQRLSSDPSVNELSTLHPLVTQARWLFGPDFDSPSYASNISLQNGVGKIFEKKMDRSAFINERKRPDLLILADSTISAVATEDFDENEQLTKMEKILLIELKRGGHKIGREEINQANGYIEDLLNCGAIDGTPHISAFVVGHEIDSKTTRSRTIGDPATARLQACTFGQLVRSASRRLYHLKETLNDRYGAINSENLSIPGLKRQ